VRRLLRQERFAQRYKCFSVSAITPSGARGPDLLLEKEVHPSLGRAAETLQYSLAISLVSVFSLVHDRVPCEGIMVYTL